MGKLAAGGERFAFSDDQARYMVLHAALTAARALNEPVMSGDERLALLARAHGLVMAVRSPVHPVGFADFRMLLREPVAALLPPGMDPAGLDRVHALDPQTGERIVDLESLDGEYGAVARLSESLGFWPWLRDELAENRAFELFRKGRDQRAYELRRGFVVRHAGGTVASLRRMMPPELDDLYVAVPGERVHGRWCFPCPLCRWPMRVRPAGRMVRVCCDDRGHRERGSEFLFELDEDREGPPHLIRIHQGARAPARVRVLAPRAGDAVVEEAASFRMVGRECWRSHVVPGLLELALFDELTARGAQVDLWPRLDHFDLQITVPREGRRDKVWKVDVKDVLSVDALIRRLEGADGRGLWLVVPDRLGGEVPLLERTLSGAGWKVRTASRLAGEVCRALEVPWP